MRSRLDRFRARGFGTAVARAATTKALTAGLIPQWRAAANNLPSIRTGLRLGFVQLGRQISIKVLNDQASELQRVLTNQAAPLRALRIRALREDPDAFGSTLTREEGLPDEHWQHWTAESDAGERSVVFVASVPEWVGMAAGFLDADRPGVVTLGAMWVDPAFRCRGLGGQLLDAVLDWASTRGAAIIELSVTESNAAAERLYSRAGFTETGLREPLDNERALTKSSMALRMCTQNAADGAP